MKWFNSRKSISIAVLLAAFCGIALAAGFERLPQPLIKMGRGLAESIQILFENDANETLTVSNTGDATFTTDSLTLGDGTATDKQIVFDRGGSNAGFLWDESEAKLKFTKDGTKFSALGTGSGGGSGVNFLQPDNNPGFEEGTSTWVASTPAQLTIETVNPLIELQSGIWDPAANLDTLETADIVVPIAYKGRSCSANFTYLWDAGTGGNITAHVQTDGGDDLTKPIDLQPTVNSVTRDVPMVFNCPTTGLIKITLTATANAQPITLDQFHLGSNIFAGVIGAKLEPLGSLTTDGTWSTNTTYDGKYFRKGNWLEAHVNVSVTGAPTATALAINLPNNWTIDQDELSSVGGVFVSGDALPGASGHVFDAGTGQFFAWPVYNNTTSVLVRMNNASSIPQQQNVTSSFPMTFASGDHVSVSFSVPILEWKGQGTTETVTLETQGWHIAARIAGADINEPSADTTSFTELTSPSLSLDNTGSVNAKIACQNGVTPTGSTCSGGDEAVGINFVAPYSGAYQVCTYMSVQGVQDGPNEYFQGVFMIAKSTSPSDTSTSVAGQNRQVIGDTDNVSSTNDTHAQNVALCDVFTLNAGEDSTFLFKRIMDKVTFTGVAYQLNGLASGFNGGRANFWSVIPLTQQFPQAVALPVDEWQRRELQSTVSTDTANLTDLRFENLVVGREYEVCMQATFNHVNTNAAFTDVCILTATQGGSAIARLQSRLDESASPTERFNIGTCAKFVASADFIQFDFAESNGCQFLSGVDSFTQLTELNHSQNTSRFTP